MSATDHDKLREAVFTMRATIARLDPISVGSSQENLDRWKVILDAAESTLPKTKMVEVWRVEYALHDVPFADIYRSEADATSKADQRKRSGFSCIRVTGPHQQEIPSP